MKLYRSRSVFTAAKVVSIKSSGMLEADECALTYIELDDGRILTFPNTVVKPFQVGHYYVESKLGVNIVIPPVEFERQFAEVENTEYD